MSDPRFRAVLAELQAMHDKKGSDYDKAGESYSNVRGSQDFGIAPWIGSMVRANDKMRRLQKAARGGTLTNEGVEDSLLDGAVYFIIGLILYREQASASASPPPSAERPLPATINLREGMAPGAIS